MYFVAGMFWCIAERLNFRVELHVGRTSAHVATLRTVEARSGDGDAFDHVVTNAVDEFGVGTYDVRSR